MPVIRLDADCPPGWPQGIVEEVAYPAAGGLEVMLDLVREFESKGPTCRQARQRSFKASYTNSNTGRCTVLFERNSNASRIWISPAR
jgi:hypothetical protein